MAMMRALTTGFRKVLGLDKPKLTKEQKASATVTRRQQLPTANKRNKKLGFHRISGWMEHPLSNFHFGTFSPRRKWAHQR